MRMLVGAYTAEMDGRACGIGVLHAGAGDDRLAGGSLSAQPDAAAIGGSPSWLTPHPTLDVVYAALEGAGSVQAFARVGEDALAPLGVPVATGELTCHVAVAPAGDALIAACWGDGRVVRIALDETGALGAATVLPAAEDPYALAGMDVEEPRPSRAHQTRFLGGGGFATTDMGLDLVRIWDRATPVQQVVLPRGSGPRHMRRHPSGHLFVVTELSNELFALAPDAAGAWRIVAGTPLSPGTVAGQDFAAEITLSRDGRFVQAGIRGSDTIAALEVRGTGAEVRPVALVESGVVWPRHHVVVRDTVLVAGQLSDEVVSLTLDERTGVPGRARHRVATASPTCLLPLG